MSRFGWAYVNDVITGSGGTPGGSDKTIQFASGSTFSGSTNFTFDYTTNIVRLTGTLYADNLIVSSSTIFKSGSTKFGDDPTDTHQFTGSVYLDNSLNVNAATNITGNLRVVGQISASNSIISNSDISAVGNITSLGGNVSASSGISSGGSITSATNITAKNVISGSSLQITNGGNFGTSLTVTGSISASVNLQTAGDVTAGMNLTINNFANIKNGLTVTGSSIITGSLTVIGIMSASSLRGDGNNITGINGANVNGVGDDWTIQFKNGVGGTLTGSSNLTFSGSTFILSGNLNVTGAIKGGYATYSSNTSIPNTSYFVGLNSVSSVLTASLLAATKYPQGQTLIFKDIGGYAGTNNILIQASGSETIDGASGVSLTANSSSVSIISNGSNGFYIVGIV
jgi:hypothetical protein